MKKANDLLEKAISLTRDWLLETGGSVNDRRKGDIASFGTALMQSGLLPAVALFSDTSNGAGKRRNQMLNVLYLLLGYGTVSEKEFKDHEKKLLTYLLKPEVKSAHNKIRQDLMQASISLKLAVRTFHLKKMDSHDD